MKELQLIIEIIKSALTDLLKFDKDIFTKETKILKFTSLQTGVQDRKLNETSSRIRK